jgi:hypothetical protein
MALPLTGTITSAMILTELGYTSTGNVLKNIVVKPGGILQVSVNDIWVNLNMCSPYLPKIISPYIVPTDWYGYNHNTTGVEILNITGDTTIDENQTVTYTATATGDNLNGVILTWYKFESNSWSLALGTGSSVTVTWIDPRNAIIKVVASNICNQNIVNKELPITYNCVPVTSGAPYVTGTKYVNVPFEVYAINSGGIIDWNVLGRTFIWEVTGPVDIVSGQGTSKVVLKAFGTTLCTVKLTIISCGNTYSSFNEPFTPVSTPDPVYYNTQQTRVVQKQCPSGLIGSYITVVRAAGTHSSNVSVTDANNQAIAWLNGTDGQLAANNDPSGTCGNVLQVGNERRSARYTKYCTSGVGTEVETWVASNSYFAPTLAEANQLADNYIAANGQNNANEQGSCVEDDCGLVINVDNSYTVISNSLGTSINNSISFSVTKSGTYTIDVKFTGRPGLTSYTFFYQAGSNNQLISIPASGTGQIIITVSGNCNSKVYTSSVITVSGTIQCSNLSYRSAGTTRPSYSNGTFTVVLEFNNYQNVRNVNGTIKFRPFSVNDSSSHFMVKDYLFYFNGIDLSAGNTIYLSNSLPQGYIYQEGTITITITSGDNICTLPLNRAFCCTTVFSLS